MTERGAQPLYLARRVYRRRRLIDAGRLLPFAGVVLFAIAMLWTPATQPEAVTARQGLYLFAIWALLIIAAWALARRLGTGDDGADTARTTGADGAAPRAADDIDAAGALEDPPEPRSDADAQARPDAGDPPGRGAG